MSTALPTMSLFRRHVPDVPEDIDMMEHFNDPNWDYRPPSPTLSTESIDLDQKEKRADSSRHSTSDFDTESNAESSYGKTAVSYGHTEQNKSQLWSSGASDLEDDSPYPEVRAAVSNVDDPSMPVNTFRMWFLGLVTVIVISGINQLMALRTSSFTLNTLVVQVSILPFGKFLAWALPTTRFRTLGYEWTLNPGPFNVKEHTVITAMANMSWTTPYVLSVFLVQEVNYGQQLSYSYKILLGLSTQIIGISYAGLYRQLLVWPSSMIYPGTLVSCSLMNTLHRTWGKREKSHISRHKFFAIVTVCATVWYFVPGYLFTGLSIFSWACWIAPTNPTVNAVFGSATGLGMGLLTFDWSMITIVSSGNPLVSPWWAELNIYGMFVFLAWIVAPILYFTNTMYAKYMPISATAPFDNTGLPYDVSLIITNGTFDQAKYEAYSPLFLTTTNALSYATCFAIIPAAIVHTGLWYGRDIIRRFRSSLADNRDVHSRLMTAYDEVPMWWYGALFLFSFVAGVVGIEIFPTGFPVWAFVVSILIPLVVLLPTGIIRAVTNQWLSLNFIADLVGGYVIPGKPVAHMIFKTYLTWPHELSAAYLADMKLGHYMKVPPRIMFVAQVAAVVLTTFVSQGVVDWVLNNVTDACTPLNTNGFTCPTNGVFGDSAIIWGAVGAQRLFAVGQLYNPFMWIILIGAILPIPLYILARRYPYSRWRYVNAPVALSSAMYFPPCTGMQFTSFFIVGAIFQWFVRRFHFRWWMRYNYILAAALDAGLAFGGILVVLFTAIPKGGLPLVWWGNTVWQNTNDAMGMPLILLPPNSTFGPTQWS